MGWLRDCLGKEEEEEMMMIRCKLLELGAKPDEAEKKTAVHICHEAYDVGLRVLRKQGCFAWEVFLFYS